MISQVRFFAGAVARRFAPRPLVAVTILIMTLVTALAIVAIPIAAKPVVEAFSGSVDHPMISGVVGPIGWLIATVIIWTAASTINSIVLGRTVLRSVMAAQSDIYTRWLNRLATLDDTQVNVVDRLTSDSGHFYSGLNSLMYGVPISAIRLTAALAFMIHISLGMTAATSLVGLAAFVLLSNSEKRILVMSDRVDKQQAVLTQLTIDTMNNTRLIQRYDQQCRESIQYNLMQKGLFDLSIKRMMLALTGRLVLFAGLTIGLAVVLVMGILMFRRGALDPANVPTYAGLSLVSGFSLIALFENLAVIARAASPLRRLTESVDAYPDPALSWNGDPVEKGTSIAICVKNLFFEFPCSKSGSFKLDIPSLEILVGQRVAFVGASGSGKTTMLSLIARELTGFSGDIHVHGRSIQSFNSVDFHKEVSYIEAAPSLLARSIGENILLAGVSEKDCVDRAFRTTGLTEILALLPEGFSTPVVRGRECLSGGQMQRLTLTRSLLLNASILLFDEALASVDAKAEGEILDAVRNEYPGNTSVIVSHRLSSVSRADYIYVFQDGKIVESGTHDHLISRDSTYRNIFKSQLIDGHGGG